MTLPDDVVAALRARDRDVAKAVVAIVDEAEGRAGKRPATARPVVDLVQVAPRRFLITINPRAITRLPGCELVPFSTDAAFLALAPGRGLADLALTVVDRLQEPRIDRREREALLKLRAAFREWMRDPNLTYEARAIVVIQRTLTGALVLPWSVPNGIISHLSWIGPLWGEFVGHLDKWTLVEPVVTICATVVEISKIAAAVTGT